MIRTGARSRRLAAEHRTVLDDARERLPPTVSLYLYGSVATGTAVIPGSDVDLLTIGLDASTAAAISSALTERHLDVCREVAIAPATAADLGAPTDAGYGLRVFLRHYCVHVRGPAPHNGLAPAYPADARAARGFNGDIARHADGWRRQVVDGGAQPSVLGRTVARKTLLATAGLHSVRSRTWTTDRRAAATALADEVDGLQELAGWLDRGPDDTAAVVRALDGPVATIVQAFTDEIGCW